MQRLSPKLLRLFAISCCLCASCDLERSNPNQPIQPTPKKGTVETEREKVSKDAIWNFATEFVRQHLKSPSSASFGGFFTDYQDPGETVFKLTEDVWGVHGWVDADNVFSANLRKDFYVEIQIKGNTASLTYLEFEGEEPFGETILPKLGEIRSEEQKAASAKRLSDSVVTRKTVGSREFFVIKADLESQSKTSFVSQFGKDLQSSSKKLKIFAWIYNQVDEYQGCLVVSKKDVEFSEDAQTYPDPFRDGGYFGFREWSSPHGQFTLKAKYVGHGNGRVMIIDEDDKSRDIELSKLSSIDQDWVKNATDLLPR